MDIATHLPKLITAVVGVLLVVEVRNLRLAIASRAWRKTTGTILKAYLDESGPDEDGRTTHSAQVTYRYTVASRSYRSSRLTYRPTSGLCFSDALKLLDGVVQGREVAVFYDPRQPARAVLVPGSSADNLVRLGFLAAALAAALWITT